MTIFSRLMESNLENQTNFHIINSESSNGLSRTFNCSKSQNIQNLPIICHSSHPGQEIINVNVPINVDRVFNLFFCDSSFLLSLLEKQKCYDIKIGDWYDSDSEAQYIKLRNVSFTVLLNHALAGTVSTKQIHYLENSKPGELYTVRMDVTSTGVPFASSFMVQTLYCITRSRSEKECNIRVTSKVIFKKYTWGIKSIIESTTFNKSKDFSKDLLSCLLQYAQEESSYDDQSDKLEKSQSSIFTEKLIDIPAGLPLTSTCIKKKSRHNKKKKSKKLQISSLDLLTLKIIIVILFMLISINVLLCVRLRGIEKAANEFDSVLKNSFSNNGDSIIISVTKNWREVTESTLNVIQSLEESLIILKKSIHELT